jgi:hypothetical protein
MDTARIRRELGGSIRLLWAREQWLWGGLFATLAGFVLWVGATGAALNYGAEFAGQPLSVTAWSSTTTVVFATVLVLWVVAPAALVTYLVDSYVTNVSGNVQTHYRVDHPVTLVAPFPVLFAVGAGAAVALGDAPAALAGALVAVGLLTLVRTVAYSYRVFSLSVPLLVHLALFVSLAVTAIALLTGAAIVAGRRAFVEDAAAGVADLLGSGTVADVLVGTTTVGPVTVSTLLGLAAVLPVGLAVGYILFQSLAGVTNRVREPDVPRSQLRTGQRYPQFARPIAEQSTVESPSRSTSTSPSAGNGTTNSPGSSPDTTTDTAAVDSDSASTVGNAQNDGAVADTATSEDDGTDSADKDDVSHTKVFTAPDDGDFDADVPDVEDASGATGGGNEETAVVGSTGGSSDDGNGYRCPTCAESFGSDTNFAYCPTCGTELQPE